MPDRSPAGNVLLRFVAVASLGFAPGCAFDTLDGRPDRSVHRNEIVNKVEMNPDLQVDQLVLKYHAAKGADEKKEIRNTIIDVSMLLMDQYYSVFVDKFSTSKKTLDAVTEIGAIAADATGAALASATTKTVLALVSGSLTATRTSITKSFFYEQTIKALVQQMQAERRAVAADLIAGTGKSVEQYPLAAALQDLERYYFAGTIDGAISGTQRDATTKEKDANQRLAEIRDDVQRISGYRAKALEWIAVHGEAAARERYVTWFDNLADAPKLAAKLALLDVVVRDDSLTAPQVLEAMSIPADQRETAGKSIASDKAAGTATFATQFGARDFSVRSVVQILPRNALANLLASAAKDNPLGLAR